MSVVVDSSVVVSSLPSCVMAVQFRYFRLLWVKVQFSLFGLVMKCFLRYSCDRLSGVIWIGSNSIIFESFRKDFLCSWESPSRYEIGTAWKVSSGKYRTHNSFLMKIRLWLLRIATCMLSFPISQGYIILFDTLCFRFVFSLNILEWRGLLRRVVYSMRWFKSRLERGMFM